MALPFDPSNFNIHDWLRCLSPYHTPKPRNSAYFDDLKKPENDALRAALIGALRPFDGGKQADRLNWVSQQIDSIKISNQNLPTVSVHGVRDEIDELIEDIIESQLSDAEVIQIKNDLTQKLNQLSSGELDQIKDTVHEHSLEHFVVYIQDCSNSYAAVTKHLEELQLKRNEVSQFLVSNPLVPVATNIQDYLARAPQAAHHGQALLLGQELTRLQNNFPPSVLYRIRDLEPLNNQAFIETWNSILTNTQIVSGNVNQYRDAWVNRVVQAVMTQNVNVQQVIDSSEFMNHLYTLASPTGKGEIDKIRAKCVSSLSQAGNLADISNVRRAIKKMLDRSLEYHPHYTQFYGVEEHVLDANEGIYNTGNTGHTLDKNMLWVLATIHSGRQLKMCSKLEINSIMRQTANFRESPSAFSNEISAFILAGYSVILRGEDYFLDPPRDAAGIPDITALSNVQLSALQSDMHILANRLLVFDNIVAAIDQQRDLHLHQVQTISSQYINGAAVPATDQLLISAHQAKADACQNQKNNVLTEVRAQFATEKHIGALQQRLLVIQAHGRNENSPPTLQIQKDNAKSLRDEVNDLYDNSISKYNLQNIDFPEVETLRNECNSAFATATSKLHSHQHQQVTFQTQSLSKKKTPDDSVTPRSPSPDSTNT